MIKNKNNTSDALGAELAKGQRTLGKREKDYNSSKIIALFSGMSGLICNKIDELMGATSDRDRRNILAEEAYRVCQKYVRLQDYNQKDKSNQVVYVYDGTHWIQFDTQCFHDFLRKWAKQMGISKTLYCDERFMNDYYSRTMFMLKEKIMKTSDFGNIILNLQNGTLVIDDEGICDLREHNPEDFIQYVLPFAYDPEAQCPMFDKFLSEILPEEDVRKVVQEFFGYCLSRNLHLEKMLVLLGSGANGKSVLLNILREMLGGQNVSHVMLSDMENDQKRGILENKLANISSESGRQIPYAIVKTLVTGEPIVVKNVYSRPREITNYGKLVVSYNELPRLENTFALHRRLLLVECNTTISRDKADPNLSKKICEQEIAGVFNFALEGLKRLVENGDFSDSPTIEESLSKYRTKANITELFINKCCEKSNESFTPGKEVLEEYRRFYAEEAFDKRNMLGRSKFYDRLERDFTPLHKQRVTFFGLKLVAYE